MKLPSRQQKVYFIEKYQLNYYAKYVIILYYNCVYSDCRPRSLHPSLISQILTNQCPPYSLYLHSQSYTLSTVLCHLNDLSSHVSACSRRVSVFLAW